MKYLLRISFDGRRFCGWQFQPNARTVQGTLTEAASALFGCRTDITGCSRTDSGVHANEFYATAEPKGDKTPGIPTERIPRALCALLPDDVAVTAATAVPDEFHARYDVLYKEYIYKIFNRQERDPFLSGFACHYPQKLDADAMNKAASAFVGRRDFAAFMAEGSDIRDTVREVKYCEVTRDGDMITLRIAADGFLYNMVRIIAGTLIDVGAGREGAEQIPTIINGKKRSEAGFTAPPDGLYLNRVIYK